METDRLCVVKKSIRVALGLFVGFVVIAVLFSLIEGKRYLKQVRRSLESEGILRPVASIMPQPSAEAFENGKQFLTAIRPLSDVGEIFPVVPKGAISEAGGLTSPFYRHEDEMPKDWDAFRKHFDAGSRYLAAATEWLNKPLAWNGDVVKIKRIRRLIAWIQASAMIRLRDGDISGAIDDLERIQQLAALEGRTGTLFNYSREQGIWDFRIFRLVSAILQSGEADDRDLVRLNEIVSRQRFVEKGVFVMGIEAALLGEALKSVENEKSHRWGVRHPAGILAHPLLVWIRDTLWPIAWKERDLAETLLDAGKNVQIGQDLLAKRNWQSRKRKATISPYDGWRFPLRDAVSMTPDSILLSATRSETKREMLIAAIALERYRLRHGLYPGKQDDLVPEFLPLLPHDWFDGKPLKYRRISPDRFQLYSVNEDGIDQGGDFTSMNHQEFAMHAGRDLVWPLVKK